MQKRKKYRRIFFVSSENFVKFSEEGVNMIPDTFFKGGFRASVKQCATKSIPICSKDNNIIGQVATSFQLEGREAHSYFSRSEEQMIGMLRSGDPVFVVTKNRDRHNNDGEVKKFVCGGRNAAPPTIIIVL